MIQYVPQRRTKQVKVTFVVPTDGLKGNVAVVGDFNGWDPNANPLRRQSGTFTTSVVLDPGRRYGFRYLAEDGQWFNDSMADDYEPNGVGGDNCVVDLTDAGQR